MHQAVLLECLITLSIIGIISASVNMKLTGKL
ncbi:MAG: prepilin-type N-terminal cleavage/methylation domain-containing protein [Chloroflexi bacterium]|nr:prepilin-type N-terminal cleavage/methylation domain-containing protein [Chloroflexota bacterium]